ncbi:hypothetical protein AVEN_203124-1 [Araneus ventricosus]|uniref:Uncharacterized protein n=1 Tax=Araneus ventricosus TaxID=182803 RepID=A0A4Y2DQ22_ARAVE|nr:hypothetical protein AVEN_203124-1 [Araneus ventricosus]
MEEANWWNNLSTSLLRFLSHSLFTEHDSHRRFFAENPYVEELAPLRRSTLGSTIDFTPSKSKARQQNRRRKFCGEKENEQKDKHENQRKKHKIRSTAPMVKKLKPLEKLKIISSYIVFLMERVLREILETKSDLFGQSFSFTSKLTKKSGDKSHFTNTFVRESCSLKEEVKKANLWNNLSTCLL